MTNMTKKVGSVLIVGGGIGGMQSALDLADAGFRVYLLEKTPSIGGTMAQLDKTFPTNDCSMCILSPKMIDIARHPNIELLTYSEVVDVNGCAGNFKVQVRKKPRYIDVDKCTGCSDCTDVCPVDVTDEFNMDQGLRKAIYIPFPQAVPQKFTIDRIGIPPCVNECPAGVDVQGYVALISQKKYKEALALEREKNPFPSVCGRVCTHPCEQECSRGEFDEPIAIRALKRFIADQETKREKPELPRRRKEKIAVVGSGPAGLTCAYYLARQGYKVNVFEALPVVGGMLAVGIPEFRLPRNMLKKDIDYIRDWGVEIKTNQALGKDFTVKSLFTKGYKSVFLALGAHKERKLGIPGEELDGVSYCIEFLRNVNLKKKVKIGNRVAVIGGGYAAVDVARTALRLGAKEVSVVYRRSRTEMPADEEDIRAAEEEGKKIIYLAAPVKILGKGGKVVGMECIQMELGPPDESGRKKPTPIKGSEFRIKVDTVIPAISQSPDLAWMKDEKRLKKTKWNTIVADSETFETSMSGVFAAGDTVTGPGVIIQAIAQGREAAVSIDRFLRGEDLKEGREKKEIIAPVPEKEVEKQLRVKMPEIPLKRRIHSFDEIELGLSEEMAVKEALRCLNCNICSMCKQCVDVCEAEAIRHDMKEEIIDIDVGAIVVATGFDLFDPSKKEEYGYGKYENVFTSKEFERYLSASGPTTGHIFRRSDHKEPKNIAFIQCVGSRDERTNEYCSSVCCMYAIKQAIIAQEHVPGLKAHIFFMDIRAFGKEFDDYYIRAEQEHGIKFIRCRIPSIEEDPETKDLIINYLENEEGKQEVFDMVVLSCALESSKSSKELSEKLGIDLNEYGFYKTNLFSPLESNKPGIYVTGASSGPKDIPMTVTDASGAAAKASSIISSERNSLVTIKEFPPERDITGEQPRIGVFVCRCGINIGAYVDVPSVVEYAKTLPYVVHAREFIYSCSQDTQEKIIDTIKEHNLNRVIVSACTPRTHEPLFQSTLREAGLNPHLFEMANIRDQCSWVHMQEPEKATEKAKGLVRMAVSKAQLIQPLTRNELSVIPRGLVIGGGVSGMTAALELATQDFETYLIERENELGGFLRKTYFMLGNEDPQELLQSLKKKVNNNEKIHVFANTEIKDVQGHVGNFKTRITIDGKKEKELEHGIVIIATGTKEYKPMEHLYGQDDRVLTKWELEEQLAKGSFSAKNVVIIQCVGCRNEERTYCSRVCCSDAIKNALKIKEVCPETNIYILYKDIRTYGFREKYYKEAAEKGILFIRYDDETKPIVTNKDGLQVSIKDPILGRQIILKPDMIALSNAMLPQDGTKELSQMLKLPITKDGFFFEAHMKLRPVDFVIDGVFLCGKAHSPKHIEECIAQASAAAARALTIISKDKYYTDAPIACVDEELCSGCGICEKICPYSAIEMITETEDGETKRLSKIIEGVCKGCGSCVSACPSGAIEQKGFKRKQIISMIDVAAE